MAESRSSRHSRDRGDSLAETRRVLRVRRLSGGTAALRNTWLLFVAWCFGSTQAADTAGAVRPDGYTIQGVIEAKSLRFSTESRAYYYDSNTQSFEVHVDDCRWLVRLGTHDPDVYDYRVVSCDGAATYFLLSYETRRRNRIAKGEVPGPNVGDGTVVGGTIPCFHMAEEAGAIWLAFASACHFRDAPKNGKRPVPFATYVHSTPILPGSGLQEENAEVCLHSDSPHLPISVAYHDNLAIQHDAARTTGLPSAPRFTNVVYQAASFTNLGNVTVPQRAIVSIHRPDPRDASGQGTQLCQSYEMAATNIVLGKSLLDFRPELPGITIVSEQRFNNGTGLSFAYFRSNTWPSVEEVLRSPAYKAALSNHRQGLQDRLGRDARQPTRRIVAALALLISVLAFPAAVWLIRKRA